jgi:mono/diheme cytochrome c family protein
MNQIKYSAYALLLVFTSASVAIVVDEFQNISVHSPNNPDKTGTSTTSKPIKNIEGKNLFQSNCGSCHALNKKLTGPALANVESRGPWSDRKNLIKWVKGSSAMVNEYDYTRKLFEEYDKQTMPSLTHLSDQEIENVFNYIKEVSTTENLPIP